MIKWMSSVLALVFLASCATAPDPLAKGAALMAQMKAASGGPKLDQLTTFHSTGTRVRNGTLTGAYESWGDVRKMKYVGTETFAGVTSTGGFDGNSPWGIGPDGKVRFETRPERLPGARLGVYLNLQGYYWPDRFPAKFEYRGRQEAEGMEFDVVTVTPVDSLPVNLWLDPKTLMLARLVGSNGTATFTGIVESYQVVDGVQVMRHGVQTMMTPAGAQTETQNILSYRFEPVSPERFAPPS